MTKVLVSVGNRTMEAEDCSCGFSEFQGMAPRDVESTLIEDLAAEGYFQELGPEDPTTGF